MREGLAVSQQPMGSVLRGVSLHSPGRPWGPAPASQGDAGEKGANVGKGEVGGREKEGTWSLPSLALWTAHVGPHVPRWV